MLRHEALERLRAAAKLKQLSYAQEVTRLFELGGPQKTMNVQRMLNKARTPWPKNYESVIGRLERLEILGLARRYTLLKKVTPIKTTTQTQVRGPNGEVGAAYWQEMQRRWMRRFGMTADRLPTPLSPSFHRWFFDEGNRRIVETWHTLVEVEVQTGGTPVTVYWWDRGLTAAEWNERADAGWVEALMAAQKAKDPLPAGLYADWLDERGLTHEAEAARSWFTHNLPFQLPQPAQYGPYRDERMSRERLELLKVLKPWLSFTNASYPFTRSLEAQENRQTLAGYRVDVVAPPIRVETSNTLNMQGVE